MTVALLEVTVNETESGIKLNTEPGFFYSKYLSDATGLNIYISDESQVDTGTHKIRKGIFTVKEAKKQGKGVILFINPVVSERKDSRGSGIDGLELACASLYPETPEAQVIEVVHNKETDVKRVAVHPDFKNSRQRIIMGLDLNEFWSKERLENYFRDCIKGKANLAKTVNVRFEDVKGFLREKGIDPMECMAGTNICDFSEDYSCYSYPEELVERLEGFYLGGSAGTAERALQQIRNIKNGKTKHIIIIPSGPPLDPYHRTGESDAKRVQTRFKIKTHYEFIADSSGREDVILKSVGLFGGQDVIDLYVNRAIEELNRDENIEKRHEIKTSTDGALGFTMLKAAFVDSSKNYSPENGLRVFNTHRVNKDGEFEYINRTIIPQGSNVCIINTGLSNHLKLKKLIAEGVVR